MTINDLPPKIVAEIMHLRGLGARCEWPCCGRVVHGLRPRRGGLFIGACLEHASQPLLLAALDLRGMRWRDAGGVTATLLAHAWRHVRGEADTGARRQLRADVARLTGERDESDAALVDARAVANEMAIGMADEYERAEALVVSLADACQERDKAVEDRKVLVETHRQIIRDAVDGGDMPDVISLAALRAVGEEP